MKIDKADLIKIILTINFLSLFTIFSINKNLFLLQASKVLIGLIIIYILKRISLETWNKFAFLIYIFFIILLCFNLLHLTGIKRWTKVLGFFVQFSEFAKISTILFLAKFLSIDNLRFSRLILALTTTLLPAFLIFKQPNLGNAIIITTTGLLMIWYKGINKKVLITSAIGAFSSIPFLWKKMLPYQKSRILAFIDPMNDPQGSSYQTTQSIIAVGAGGLFGSNALQNKLGFVPENHTDFLFSYFAEKNGFILTVILVLLIIFGILKVLKLAASSCNEFHKLFLFGFATLWSIQSIMNISMNIGIMPVTGIVLPYFSYGGSALLSFFIILGITFNMLKLNK